MHEIINISLSHRSNHLITQFYNCLEPLLYDVDHDNSIFMKATIDKISKTVSYAPRVLLWDAQKGAGSLGMYEYSSEEDHFDKMKSASAKGVAPEGVIHTHERVRKSPYQIALDKGGALPPMDDQIARYWSDYNKIIYEPGSLNTLKEWYHDADQQSAAPCYENLSSLRFDKYEMGVEEFKVKYCDEFFDVNLHQQLESCDTLQGFNIITELDNAWGGFASKMLLELKDELPKSTYMTYGWNQDDAVSMRKPMHSVPGKFQPVFNKIRSTVELLEHSDLFFPLYAKSEEPYWKSTGEVVLLFDSINSVFHGKRLSTETKRMPFLVDLLTSSESKKNVVSKLDVDSYNSFSFYSKMPHYRTTNHPSHVFSSCDIKRSIADEGHKCGLSHVKTYPWTDSDTVPKDYSTCNQCAIGVTEKTRDVFKTWEDLVSKYLRYDSFREELKDNLGTYALEYEHGWYEDETSDDDY